MECPMCKIYPACSIHSKTLSYVTIEDGHMSGVKTKKNPFYKKFEDEGD